MYLGICHTFPEKKRDSVTPVTPKQTLFSNSAYSLLQKNITFWKIYKSSSCRKTTFPVPPFKSLYQSSKSCSLKTGYLGDPQGGSEECSVLLTTKHTSWEMAHITSQCLPKQGSNIFFPPPGEPTGVTESQVRPGETPIWSRACLQQGVNYGHNSPPAHFSLCMHVNMYTEF